MSFIDELEQMTAATPGKGTFTPGSIIALIRQGKDVEANIRRLRYFLAQLGILGCGTTKRITAITTQLGLSASSVGRMIQRINAEEKTTEAPPEIPRDDFPDTPEDLPVSDCDNPALCPEQPSDPEDDTGCQDQAESSDWKTGEQETDDKLPEAPDCEAAKRLIADMKEIATPLNPTVPLLSKATYLNFIYKLIALKDLATEQDCPAVDEAADDLLIALSDIIPRTYLNPKLLPDWWPNLYNRPFPYPDYLAARKIADTRGIIYKRTIELPDGTLVEYEAGGEEGALPGVPTTTIEPPTPVEDEELTTQAAAEQLRENQIDIVRGNLDLIDTLLADIEPTGISQEEAAPWIDIIEEAIALAHDLGQGDTEQRLRDALRQIIDAAGTFTGDPTRQTPPGLTPPGTQEE